MANLVMTVFSYTVSFRIRDIKVHRSVTIESPIAPEHIGKSDILASLEKMFAIKSCYFTELDYDISK